MLIDGRRLGPGDPTFNGGSSPDINFIPAPPVSTSTWSTSGAGMKLMSGDEPPLKVGSPGPRRRPSISTRVRCEPRPRRLTLAVPVAPFEMLELIPANTCGSWFSRSAVWVVPVSLTSSLLTTWTGLELVRFGCGMREPVTTISPTVAPGAGVLCANAWPPATSAAPQIMDEAKRRARVDWMFT